MKARFSSIALLSLVLSWTVLAQRSRRCARATGRVTMKMNMPGMGDMPPMTQTQCVTAAMLKDPQGAVPKGPEGGDCKISDYKLHGEHRHLQDDLHAADADDDDRRDEVHAAPTPTPAR